MGKKVPDNFATTSQKWALMEYQHFYRGSEIYTAISSLLSFLIYVNNCQSFQYVRVCNFTNIHSMTYRSDFFIKCFPQYRCHHRKVSIKWALMISILATWINHRLCNYDNPKWTKWPPWEAKMRLTTSLQPAKNKNQWLLNSMSGDSVTYTAMNCIVLFLNLVLHCHSSSMFLCTTSQIWMQYITGLSYFLLWTV